MNYQEDCGILWAFKYSASRFLIKKLISWSQEASKRISLLPDITVVQGFQIFSFSVITFPSIHIRFKRSNKTILTISK